ncbi:hypothetical protein K2173_021329 [Erythroxylum novogranatense]|uniref:Chromo domain-containing protein n=1 Tax=Erythroxylum novogranatense TaxID=1862640 RepID=A0AAV8TUN1_9ROSI|nr:hypothetical protein K2173_021329 [Erythroxylum novogranatense]
MGSTSKEDSGSDAETSSGDIHIDRPLFSEEERVLAYHGSRIYQAKVLKIEYRKKEWRYLVHYLGWSKNWDEWVGKGRLLKDNEENIRLQQDLVNSTGADKTSKFRHAAHTKPKSSAVAKGKKGRDDSSIEKDLPSEKCIKVQIPSILKKQLADDWEFVNQQQKLVKLPRSPNVDDILTKYSEYKSKKDGMVTDSLGEFLKGIRCYFDKALPAMLLYTEERQQFHDSVENDVSPSTVYGAEHLLRLFVKLPELLTHVGIEEDTLTCMQQMFLEFIKFLHKNQSGFFLSAYDGPKIPEDKGKGKDE